jgi:hypothetical protein
MPTVLDLIGYNGKAVSFGKSVLQDGYRFSVQYVNGVYQLIDSSVVLQYNGKIPIALYEHKKDPLLKTNILDKKPALAKSRLNYLKAFLQQYFYRMQNNKLSAIE